MATQADLMKAYRPRRPDTKADDAIFPEERARRAQMKQEAQDEKDREKIKAMGYAKGGSASSRADGCAQRGKTKGRMV
jgi:hypothetical protein